jgi:hypothetical protein
MPETIMYHEGNHCLQDQFDGHRISDRLEEKLTRTAFTVDKAFIESAIDFFIRASIGRRYDETATRAGSFGEIARAQMLVLRYYANAIAHLSRTALAQPAAAE